MVSEGKSAMAFWKNAVSLAVSVICFAAVPAAGYYQVEYNLPTFAAAYDYCIPYDYAGSPYYYTPAAAYVPAYVPADSFSYNYEVTEEEDSPPVHYERDYWHYNF